MSPLHGDRRRVKFCYPICYRTVRHWLLQDVPGDMLKVPENRLRHTRFDRTSRSPPHLKTAERDERSVGSNPTLSSSESSIAACAFRELSHRKRKRAR
jgi:hypothetical protein